MVFTRRTDGATTDLVEKFSAKQTPIEAPLTARLTRSPTGELANLAAASRTPTQAQRDARAEAAAAGDRDAAPTRTTAATEGPKRGSSPAPPAVSLTVQPQRGVPATGPVHAVMQTVLELGLLRRGDGNRSRCLGSSGGRHDVRSSLGLATWARAGSSRRRDRRDEGQ